MHNTPPRPPLPTLAKVAASLAPGGYLLLTGHSISFLHPALMRRVGFEHVACASFDATHAGESSIDDPPEHDFGRLQLFLLRNRKLPTEAVDAVSAASACAALFAALAGDTIEKQL